MPPIYVPSRERYSGGVGRLGEFELGTLRPSYDYLMRWDSPHLGWTMQG